VAASGEARECAAALHCIVVRSDTAVAPQKGIAHSRPPSLDAFVVSPNLKETQMRLRLFRVLYLIATVTAFVIAAGAGRKFGG
jgi:hypothetical protein